MEIIRATRTAEQAGAHFRKDGRLYNIQRNQQMKQAHKAGIDYAYK